MRLGNHVNRLTPGLPFSHSDRTLKFAMGVALTAVVIGLMGLTHVGCKACRDGGEAPIAEPLPAPTPEPAPEPSKVAPLPEECKVTDSVHRYSLKGDDLGLPPAPEPGLEAKYVAHYGGPARAVTYVGKHLVWAQGSTLKGPGIDRDLGVVVNDLVTYTDKGKTKLVASTRRGLKIFSVSSNDSLTIDGELLTIDSFGEVRGLRAIVSPVPVTPPQAIPQEVSVSLNAPPPGTTVDTYPSALFFTTSSGYAYRLEGNCITELYNPDDNKQDERPLKAVAVAGDARTAVVLAEEYASPAKDKLPAVSAALQALRDGYPGLTREGAHDLLGRMLHLGGDQQALQALYRIDLVKKEATPFWVSGSGITDAVVNDIVISEKRIFVHGLFFDRDTLNSNYPKTEDRWGLPARLAPLFNGPNNGQAKDEFLATAKSGVLSFDVADMKAAPTFIGFPAKPNAVLAPFFGALTTYGGHLYFRGPFGYVVATAAEGKEPALKGFDGSAQGFPRDIAIDDRGEKLAFALGGTAGLETAPLTAQGIAGVEIGPVDPMQLEAVTNGMILFKHADGSHHILLDRTTGARTDVPSYANKLVEAFPDKSPVVTSRHADFTTINGKSYLVVAGSVKSDPDQYWGGIGLYPLDGIPAMTATMDEIADKFKAKQAFQLMLDIFDAGGAAGNPVILDMRAGDDSVILLFAAEDAVNRFYRAAAYQLFPKGDGSFDLKQGEKSPMLKVTRKEETVVGFAPHVTITGSSTIGPYPLDMKKKQVKFKQSIVANVVAPEGVFEYRFARVGSMVEDQTTVDFFENKFSKLSSPAGAILACDMFADKLNLLATDEGLSVLEHGTGKEKAKLAFATRTESASVVTTGDDAFVTRWSELLESSSGFVEGLTDPAKATFKELYHEPFLFLLTDPNNQIIVTTEDNGIAVYKF